MADLAAMARSHQPGLIIADRTVGGPYENIVTPEQTIPDKSMNVPWETCLTLGTSWKYIPGDQYKSPAEVTSICDEILSKGGNLLLGVGPDPRGMIPAEATECLGRVGSNRSHGPTSSCRRRPKAGPEE